MSDPGKRILRKIAAEAYDAIADQGHEFDLDYIRELVIADPAIGTLGDALLEAAAEAAVAYVDESRRNRSEQEELFGDLDGVLAIGDGRRRRKGSCTMADYAAHMQIIAANAAAVASATARKQEEFAQLLPYLSAGDTVEQAVAKIRDAA